MAIKVIRICDECKTEHEQVPSSIDKELGRVEYPISFTCSNCSLKKAEDAIKKS